MTGVFQGCHRDAEHSTAALPEEKCSRCTKINTGSGPAIDFWVRDVPAIRIKLNGVPAIFLT